MAQCKQTAQEFVQNAFAPMVAVLCSHDAELVCQKNNLSFVELIQPFCRLTTEAHVRDPGLVAHTVHNLRINVRDMNAQPPNPALARKMLNDAVANAQPQMLENSRASVITVGDYDLQLTASTPWYEAYREMFLQVSYPSDHEYTKHFLACIFVVSSAHADPMDQFSKLTQQQHTQQHQMPNKLPKWFCPNIFRYYVIIHDVADQHEAKAEAIYQSMKSTYGVSVCHLLQINSHSGSSPETTPSDQGTMPDPWSQFLTKKSDSDMSEYEMAASQADNEAFPSKLSEGNSGSTVDLVEAATEAIEETEVQPQSSIVIDHPLAPESEVPATAPNTLHLEPDNRIPRDSQNNPIGSGTDRTKSAQHGCCLTLSDHDRLRIFIHEFIVRGLIPWAERTLRTLSEQVTSRKGFQRSFFVATKKWFGGNKPAGPAATTEKANVVYTPEAPEMQMRRMADMAFMFQLYEIAYQTYHTCKRDFNNDHAWLYYAGALEMACLAVFMQGNASQRQYPHHYMESAVSTYLNTCKSPQFATRSTLLSSEALKSKGMFAEAAMQFIKMTSEPTGRAVLWNFIFPERFDVVDSDLRSALLLEQAAHCFINMKVPMVRKYSFHMILAGHRFSKAGQRKHALRSYSQALQVYKGKDWTLAEDHINFTIGRQSFNLKQLDNATSAFKHLLTVESKQTLLQQSAFLREYLFVFKQQLAQASLDGVTTNLENLPQLPLPVVDGNKTRVLLAQQSSIEEEDQQQLLSFLDLGERQWPKLEELALMSNGGSLPANYRPSVLCYTNRTKNGANPVSVVQEPVTVEVSLRNPLKIPLVLADVVLLWKFLPVNFIQECNQEKAPEIISNEVITIKNQFAKEVIETQLIPEVVIQGNEEKAVLLSLTPLQTGELHIVGLAYNLGSSSPSATVVSAGTPQTVQAKPSFVSSIYVRGRQNLEVQGPRLNSSKAEKTSKMYGPDRRLDLVVAPRMPLLEVSFSGFPESVMCGEVQHVVVEFKNSGHCSLCNLRVTSPNPEFFTFSTTDCSQENGNSYQTVTNFSDTESEEFVAEEQIVEHVMNIPLPGGHLEPGCKVTLPMWIRGPDAPGVHERDFLFYYQSTEANPKLRHRVHPHRAVITASHSIGLRALAQRTTACSCTESYNSQQLNTITVSLEIENLNQVHDPNITEFSILQVSCASCRWHLQHLSTQKHSDIKVSSKETALMCFRACRCQHQCQKSSRKEVIFTNVAFDQLQINSSVTPCSDFYFRSLPIQKLEDLELQPTNPAFQVPDKKAMKTPCFKELDLAVSVELTLIVLWKAFMVDESGESHVITGQHHVTIDSLNTPIYAPAVVKTPIEQPPVKIIKDPQESQMVPSPKPEVVSRLLKYTFKYHETVLHDFSRQRVCRVPVRLLLHNCSDTKIQVQVDTGSERDRCHPDRAVRQALPLTSVIQDSPSSQFSWAGCSITHLQISPGLTSEFMLHACFSTPGVFHLGTLTVLAGPADSVSGVDIEMAVQKSTAQSLIVVEAS